MSAVTATAVGLFVFNKIAALWKKDGESISKGIRADSLIDYTQTARVEPIVLIDADCLYVDFLSDVQQSLLSIFAGYYLQALAVSTRIGKISVDRHLDKLNPRRDVGGSATNMGWLMATEAYKDKLPSVNDISALEDYKADQQKLQERALVLQESSRQDTLNRSEVNISKDTFTTIKELSNLSVGKLFSVDITDGINKASVPVSIRLMASSMPTSSLIHILSIGSKDNSFKERYHLMKAGRIEFIRDLILCQDLIDEHRKNLMNDKDGVYSNIVKRANTNKLAGLVSANPSVATASNICIISAATAEQLELHLNGKLSNFKIRQRVFENTYMMILVVLDNSWRRATFYHRGINMPTEVSAQDMKASNRGNGLDVADILSAYRAGAAPSL